MESSASGNAAACAHAFALRTLPLKPCTHDGVQDGKKTNKKTNETNIIVNGTTEKVSQTTNKQKTNF